MIDTHAHLYFESFKEDREQVLFRCQQELSQTRPFGIINIGISLTTSHQAVALALAQEQCLAAIGVHPEEASSIPPADLPQLATDLSHLYRNQPDQIVAVGEIGLDYHAPDLTPTTVQQQKILLQKQLELALALDLPIIVHSRDAFADTFSMLNQYRNEPKLRGVWHSFTGNLDQVQQVLPLNFAIGVNGIVTFPSARDLRTAITATPLDRLLLETDAPFLAPQAQRGQRNEPWMIKYVADEIGTLHQLDFDRVVQVIDQNTCRLFGLGQTANGALAKVVSA